jgi:hypothetical protein
MAYGAESAFKSTCARWSAKVHRPARILPPDAACEATLISDRGDRPLWRSRSRRAARIGGALRRKARVKEVDF